MLLSSRCVDCVPNKRSLEIEEIVSVVIIHPRKMLHTYNLDSKKLTNLSSGTSRLQPWVTDWDHHRQLLSGHRQP